MSMDGRIGIEEQGVSDAINNLDMAKAALFSWRDELLTLKGQVATHWLGEASGQFEENYAKLNEDMSTMEDAVNAFKMWATETLDSYQALDRAQTNSMSMI